MWGLKVCVCVGGHKHTIAPPPPIKKMCGVGHMSPLLPRQCLVTPNFAIYETGTSHELDGDILSMYSSLYIGWEETEIRATMTLIF